MPLFMLEKGLEREGAGEATEKCVGGGRGGAGGRMKEGMNERQKIAECPDMEVGQDPGRKGNREM